MVALKVKSPLLDAESAFSLDVPRHTIRDVIAEKIAVLITSGVLSVGDELPSERELASALSVSRETVRGAIQLLSAHGILTVSQGARTSVAKSDLGSMILRLPNRRSVETYDLESVHAARSLVERSVAAEAARRITGETLAELRQSLAVQKECIDDPVRFLICDREFHLAIYQACGNPLLADIATDLYTYLLEHRRRIVARPGSIETSINDHRAILDGLSARDELAVVAAFAVHEMRIYETTRGVLAEEAKSRV